MNNLKIYDLGRHVPSEAKKTISAGRLKGKTDINPMWRIKKLTELFGPAGVGWYYEITNRWADDVASDERVVNIEIALYFKHEGEWSKPIYGLGGSTQIAKESKGYYNDDDAYKKALTDAISIACKALGIGADVWFERDTEKTGAKTGDREQTANHTSEAEKRATQTISKDKVQAIIDLAKTKGIEIKRIEDGYQKPISDLNIDEWMKSVKRLEEMEDVKIQK